MNTEIAWPPHYILKKHPRARHVKLKASIKGLELIVPPRFRQQDIPLLLEKHKSWIVKKLLQLELKLQAIGSECLPDMLEFRGIHQTWKIQYVASNAPLKIMIRPHQEIVLLGNIENKTACQKILSAWIKNQAKAHLPEQLQLVSKQTGLNYSSLTIRNQQTRWGSCSRKKSINLNYKLILFPPALMKHILIHELCHTVHLNHSTQFWQLVSQHDPDWKEHRRLVRQAREMIPSWV